MMGSRLAGLGVLSMSHEIRAGLLAVIIGLMFLYIYRILMDIHEFSWMFMDFDVTLLHQADLK